MELDKVKAFLKKEKNVRVAYLFGSHARGETGPLSDIDIAVLLDRHLNKQESFDLKLKLINTLSSILKTDKLDIVVMNHAPLLLNHNIISKGKVLDTKNETERVMFETTIMSQYLDRKHYNERHTRIGIKRMAKRGIM